MAFTSFASNLVPGDTNGTTDIFVALNPLAPAPSVAGDLNGDGKVSLADVSLALRFAVGDVTPTAAQLKTADVFPNPGTGGGPIGDGKIALADVLLLLRIAVGLVPTSSLQPTGR